ncbi:GNAT family N-acetyltransferase [Methylovirgula sp. 4M-Z18]|uniref:GNAT family N-acetyltransferase n=1 Tax=Methylovirgula sp. 4M-Z18 TaxID=2293567 RepID=UPI000E2F22DC|nr:GNAT family N-acetyltransferase [Methylovirgula sp. 4M-Z18]RFB79809.1 GNAT family N-acetyltransferase [Methylovirgula sp. 4M-Z18]
MAVPESLVVDSYEMQLADIRSVALDQLHALSIAVGWPHREDDWRFLLNMGHGFAALDEIGRVFGSAMWFPYGRNFATIGMVITSPRLQTNGTGRWLMEKMFETCGSYDFRLSATRASRRLYTSLKFDHEKTVYQCQGEAYVRSELPPLPDGISARQLGSADMAAVTSLDARAFGVGRAELMARLFDHSVGYGLFRGDELVAFSLCRPFGRGHVIGPVVAHSEEEAIAVISPHVAAHTGHFLRLDTHFGQGALAAFLTANGLLVYDTVLTMSRGRRLGDFEAASGGAMTFALAAQTFC